MKALKDQHATVVDGGMFQASVVLESDEHGARAIIYQGSAEIAQRVCACWNAQYGVPLELVQAPVVGYIYSDDGS